MKTVVICGSRRFKPEARQFAAGLRKLGVTVYESYFHSGQKEWQGLSSDYQKFIALGLTHDHFYKIKMADVFYLYNKGGYAGVSTTMELACAVVLGKPVYAFSDEDPELCRKVLIREVVKTPKALVKKLR